MYLNDLLEISVNKKDTFNLRIVNPCQNIVEGDDIEIVLTDKNNNKVFSKKGFVYKNMALISFTKDDVNSIPIGEYDYSIYISLKNKIINDTIVTKNKFKMEG